ncbi:MAG: hypothetical protein HUU55_07455 [Myxococcales bacterium]|nr:hypothetical protein [Myxococcales bacterium]
MTRWIDRLRDRFPSTWPPVIGVVGSNGKGSTAAMVHSILSQVLHNVGRYTSPHFFDFRERIRVGSADVTDSELGLALDWLDRQMKSAADDKDSDPTTAFECFTVLALFVFLHAQVDTIVAEAGMGGRLDPTGCLHPAAVAFSSVDLEHTEVLGVTLEQIALEKAAIAHPGATLWLGAMPKDIVDVVRSFCAFSQVIVRQAPFCDKPVLGDSGQKMDIVVGDRMLPGVFVPLLGSFQAQNASLAANVAVDVLQRLWQVSETRCVDAVYRGLAATSWPGRMQLVCQTPPVVVDVGHSPDAVSQAALGVVELAHKRPIHVVLGVSANKPFAQIVAAVVPAAHSFYCTRARHRGAAEDLILQTVREMSPQKPAVSFPSVAAALEHAIYAAINDNGIVWVAGGFFLAAEATAVLRGVELDMELFY